MTIIKKKTSFLKNQTKDEFVSNLLKSINSNALEIYIFGSFFSLEFNEDSDLDIVLIAKTNIDFFKRQDIFPELLDFFIKNNIPYDLLVYTPEELEKFKTNNATEETGFWKTFFKTATKIR